MSEKIKEFMGCFPGYCIQTFDDKSCKGSNPKRKTLPELVYLRPACKFTKKELEELNQKGAGIYFTPQNYGQVRRADKNCQGINTWIIEMDNISKEKQMEKIKNSPLKPSIIVETRNSYHVYWLANDGKISTYKEVIKGLIEYFDSDKACKDRSRVLRIPGFYHMKEDPYLVKIVELNSSLKYFESEIIKAFPQKKQEIRIPAKTDIEDFDFWETASKLDNKEVLKRLSGTAMVKGEIFTFRERSSDGEYLDVNGEPADAWIDRNGMIGSGKGFGPTFIQWLEFYGHNKSEIAKWIRKDCKDLLPEKFFKQALKKDTPKDVLERILKNFVHSFGEDQIDNINDNPFTWGSKNLDCKISPIERHHFIIFSGETGGGKTAFTFDMAIKNAQLGHKVLYLSLEMDREALLNRVGREAGCISKEQWRDKSLITDIQKKKYLDKKKELTNLKKLALMGFGNESTIIENIICLVKEVKPDLVFIDNFDLVERGGRNNLEGEDIIAKKIMGFTNDIKIPIVMIHHYKKENSNSNRGIESLRGSAKIGHSADTIVVGLRTKDKDCTEEQKAEFVVAQRKDRDFGIQSSCKVYFHEGSFYDNYKGSILEKDNEFIDY